MDPLADKCLVMAALCWFVENGDMVGWVLAAVLLRRAPLAGMEKSIAAFWLFMVSWMVITFVSLFSRQKSWDPIPHTASLTLDQMHRS